MIKLSFGDDMTNKLKKELYPLLMNCVEKPCYKVLYCVATHADARSESLEVAEWVKGISDIHESVNKYIISYYEARIEFKNGSWFRVIAATKNARGNRCNAYVVAPNVPYDIQRTIIEPMLIDYERQRACWDNLNK